ncbi:MepB family protein [Flavobacterium sp. GSA192]|uniref:MepB family protein n=1 Tax=Flavobacterium sp. GSA192 TaxID=2576304 RepID=UPI00112CF79B|nr:MepB family protein [Flavobacterium sp. GSA192]
MIAILNFLHKTNELVFNKLGLEIKSISLEKESADYNPCQLLLNEKKALFRTAKITPTKTGQFVTLWKRIPKGPIAPFAIEDNFDLVIINTETENHFGQFVFPKSILIEKGIFSTALKEGKRAIRVYPPWDKTTSKQAQQTQQWQLKYFMVIPFEKDVASQLYF